MISPNRKWWLAALFLLWVTPASFAQWGHGRSRLGYDHNRGRDCRQMPENGSSATYLLAAGLTCLGAIVFRSRMAKPKQS